MTNHMGTMNVTNCRVCAGPMTPFLSFGRMPIANGFLMPDQFADEYFFDMAVCACPRCHMVQLAEQPDPARMFHDHYAFFSSTSAGMARHFEAFAADVRARYLQQPDPLVIELGSNDGITLRHFAKAGIRHIGVEPSANVAEAARAQGVFTISEFFGAPLAERILADHGHADAILAANVMCHIPDLHSVMDGVSRLLTPTGVLVFEDPYLGDIVEKTSYDQIYDEHAFYFSVASVSALVEGHGLEVVDVMPQPTHGGSMRYVIARTGARPVTAAVEAQRAKERALGLHQAETWTRFASHVEASRDALVALVRRVRREGHRVVGYAATSKSTTVINYCGLTPDDIEFISDTTPIKQGRFSPGMHIPVRPYEAFAANPPAYALLFGWNHAAEILAKEQAFTRGGGRWIVYVPTVEVRS